MKKMNLSNKMKNSSLNNVDLVYLNFNNLTLITYYLNKYKIYYPIFFLCFSCSSAIVLNQSTSSNQQSILKNDLNTDFDTGQESNSKKDLNENVNTTDNSKMSPDIKMSSICDELDLLVLSVNVYIYSGNKKGWNTIKIEENNSKIDDICAHMQIKKITNAGVRSHADVEFEVKLKNGKIRTLKFKCKMACVTVSDMIHKVILTESSSSWLNTYVSEITQKWKLDNNVIE